MNTINNVLWAKKFGSGSSDIGKGIAVDSSGNAYVTGNFDDTATFGSTTLTTSGFSNTDVFVTKLDSSGKFLWAQKFGGTSYDIVNGITIDSSGNSYITGYFDGTATFGNITLTTGNRDAFVTKLDSSGNVLWAQKFGGTSYSDEAYGITVDSSNNIYVTGRFSGIATFGSTTLTSTISQYGFNGDDAFITKLDTSGNVLWAKKLGGTSLDNGYDIAADGAGNTYLMGSFYGTATFGNTTLTSDAMFGNPFLTKLDSSGNVLWAKKFDIGNSYNSGSDITVDSLGNTYITGSFYNTATFGNTTLTSAGSNDAFITKFDSNGNVLWAQKLGGTSDDFGNGITVDSLGNIYVTGRFSGTATFGNTTLSGMGNEAFVAKLDSNGNVLSAQKLSDTSSNSPYMFGSSYYSGVDIAIDGADNTYVTGGGGSDGFIVKLGQQDITLALTPSSVVEDGSNNLIYTFTREGNTTNPVTLNFNVGGNATFNTDYTVVGADTFTTTNGTVTFAAGATTATVTIEPSADTIFEPDETVALTLATGGGYTIVTSGAVTGNITNDDTQVTLAVTPSSVVEDGTNNLTYTFTRQGQTTDPLTVNFNVGGNATVDNDYTQSGAASFSATNGTVTFAAGATTATVTIDPTADTTVESDETVGLTLAAGTGYSIGTSEAVTGNITNDDTQISLAVTRSTSGSNVLWAQKFGGTSGEIGWSIAADNAGNTYVTGAFTNTANFGNTALTSTGFGNSDAFVAKFDSSGKVLWAQKLGGTSTDFGYGITVDGAGNSYATGNFSGTATFGSTTLTSTGNEDAFVTKLDSSGNFLWAQKLGGTSSDSGYSITTDGAGNTYVTGVQDALSILGSVQLGNFTSSDNAFITKLDNNGNVLWTKNLSGVFSSDRGHSITSDGTGNTYVTGFFSGTTTFGNTTLTSAGNLDAFITKLDSSGNFLWAQKLGGTLVDTGLGITSDGVGNIYATGVFSGTATFGSTTLTSAGDEDAFVAKLDGNGNVVWAKKFGSIGVDNSFGIVTDGLGNIYLTGAFNGTVSFGSTTLTSAGDEDAFIAKLDSDGNILSAYKLGGTLFDSGIGITSDGKGNIYATGGFLDTGSFGNTSLTSGGSLDGFVVKLAEPQISLPLTPNSVVEDGSNNLIYTFTRQGQTTDPLTVNFNVGGDATLNTDYTAAGANTFTATNGTVTFAAGATIASVTIDPTADTIFEPDETVGLTLAAGTGYGISTSEAVTGNIINDDTQISLSVTRSNIVWAQKFGGTSVDIGWSIAADASGNTYVTGDFSYTATFGSTTLTTAGYRDTFVTKLDSSGNVIWAQKLGVSSSEIGNNITVDASGNTYLTGYFFDTATFGNTTVTSAGNSDAFVTKLDSNGNFLWAQKFGGTSYDFGDSITVDSSGNAYIGGYFSDTITFGNTTLTSAGNDDAFIAKLDSSGNVVWAKNLGGTSYDYSEGIATDEAGNTYLTGSFSGTATFGSTTLTSAGYRDTFVTKLDSSGNVLWGQKFGGTLYEQVNDITVDASGNTYVTGNFYDTSTFGNITLTSAGSDDVFIAKLDSNGNVLWAKNLGGTSYDQGNDITIDSSGNVYVTGSFSDTVSFGDITLTSAGEDDAFVIKLDSNGNILSAQNFGGTSYDRGLGIASDGKDNIYATGRFLNTSTFGNTSLTSAGSVDAYIVKLAEPQISLPLTPNSVVEDGSNNLTYTFTRQGQTTEPLTVNFNVGGDATLNTDYTALGADTFTATNGTVTFAAGATTASVTIDPTADTTFEPDETVGLTLAEGTGYNIGTYEAVTGNITNDDTQVTLALAANSVAEDGTDNLTYTFTRQGQTTNPLTVNFNVAGTATVDNDYTQTGAASFTATNGTVTFKAGATTASVTIDPTTDTTVESDETVGLTLAAGTGYTIGTSEAVTGNITNDDTQVTLAVTPSSVTEDGSDNLTYTFTRQGQTTDPLTVNFNVSGDATFNDDYTTVDADSFSATNGTVTFKAGATTATVTIDPTTDTKVEPDEILGLTLATGTGYTIGTSEAVTGKITNDDITPALKATPAPNIGNIFNLEGEAKSVQFLLKSASSGVVNEIGLFTVDDDKGTIGGVAPDDPKYAQKALENSRSIFSSFGNRPSGFNDNLTSTIDLDAGIQFRLLLVQNSTIDGLRNGTVPLSQMLLSSPTSSPAADGKFDLSFPNSPGTVVQMSLGTQDLKGSALQDKQQGEVLDLTKLTGTQTATFTVYREAAFDNLVGFYRVADANGAIDTNNDGVGDLLPGQAGYAEAAVKNRVGDINLRVGNQGTASFTGTFEGGSIFAPFLIVKGTVDPFLDNNPNNNPAIYFPYLGANSDNVDHVRMLGNNIFGFEDLSGGGDKDFNDIIVSVKFS